MIEAYKQALAAKPCREFQFGEGTCPFGSSCFYGHIYRDGRDAKAEAPHLRHQTAADGATRIMREVRLSNFLEGALQR